MSDTSSTASNIPWMKVIFVSLGIVAIIIICVVIYKQQVKLAVTQPMLIPKPTPFANTSPISGTKKAKLTTTGHEYTYNFWMNVSEWGKGMGTVKNVLTRSKYNPNTIPLVLSNPSICFYPNDNNLAIRVSTLQNNTQQQYDTTLYPPYTYIRSESGGSYSVVNPIYYYNNGNTDNELLRTMNSTTVVCDVANIPIQRWVMVTVILWNRTLDVYINGMLVRSAVLPGVPLFDPKDLNNIYVGNNASAGTINGNISRLKYYQRAITAKEVMGLYRDGPLPASFWWSNLKHNIKITLSSSDD